MHTEFVGVPGGTPFNGNLWNNPSAWADGQEPASSNGLHVAVDTFSNANVGASGDPFITNDVIGATVGLSPSYPLFISGNLSVHDLSGFSQLNFYPGGPATLDVRHDLANVLQVNFIRVGTLEVGHNFGTSAFQFASGPLETLILDKPPHGSLDNSLTITSSSFFNVKVELGDLAFDSLNRTQNPNGSSTIQLTEHGSPVYELTNLTIPATAKVSVGGPDPQTGYDFLTFHS